jgi:hypothetical protein
MNYYKKLNDLNNKRKQLYLDIKNISNDKSLLQYLTNTSSNIDFLLESLFEDEGDLEENKILVQEMLEFHIANLENLKNNIQKINEAFFIGEDDIDEYDVENEQDIKEFVEFMREYQQQLNEADCDCLLEAKYQGRTVPLGKPMRGDSKKFKVYVKNPKTGKVVKVNFGAKGMNIKKNNPVRRKAFRARHNCANPGPRTKARYWSCRKW